MNYRVNDNRGFTFIELMMAVAVFALFLSIIFAIVKYDFRFLNSRNKIHEADYSARNAMVRIVELLRSYNKMSIDTNNKVIAVDLSKNTARKEFCYGELTIGLLSDDPYDPYASKTPDLNKMNEYFYLFYHDTITALHPIETTDFDILSIDVPPNNKIDFGYCLAKYKDPITKLSVPGGHLGELRNYKNNVVASNIRNIGIDEITKSDEMAKTKALISIKIQTVYILPLTYKSSKNYVYGSIQSLSTRLRIDHQYPSNQS